MAAKIGCGTPEYRFVAAHHDGERRRARAFHAAAHRTVEKADAERVELRVQCARRACADGGAVHDDHVRAQSRLEARDHGAHVLVGGHADHDGLAIAGEFRQVGEGETVQFAGQRLGLVGGSIPDARQ